MPINFVAGDIFATPLMSFPALAHGCNCKGKMGKGIAVMFREMWPEMYDLYNRLCREGTFRPGNVMHWQSDEFGDPHVFNLFTQDHWKDKATLAAIEQAVLDMIEIMEEQEIPTVTMPRIGAGLGGLPWAEVRDLLVRIGEDAPRRLIVVEDYVHGKALHPKSRN